MDRFSKEYTPISDTQKELVAKIKNKCEEIEAIVAEIPNSLEDAGRLKAIAITQLEIFSMCAVKAATGKEIGV
jgi:hypothetical protein